MPLVPELLAPAGSHDSLIAAVAAGADAVYLGGKTFGARQYAANFSGEELENAISYAHKHGVKVYVTVNTLATDEELPKIAEYLIHLSNIGADAILVQDVGVLAIAREVAPELPVHASTQMTIHNEAGLRFAAKHGITRVVLARELSFEEVKQIQKTASELNVELEVFIHGAVCYAYSGQCLFSSAIGGRSGNRGMCAQPCRKPYTLLADGDVVETQGKYPLSPRDLCTYPFLLELCELGVAALKIEGRMKSPEYVAIVVDAYRKALDNIAAKDAWEPDEETLADLAFAFNRGFTKGYLFGDKNSSFINTKKPDNRGVFAGFVSGVDEKRGKVIVKIDGPVPDTGDGLVFLFAGRETGFSLNKEPYIFPEGDAYKIPAPPEVLVGSELWITRRLRTEKKASAIISQNVGKKIPIDVTLDLNDEGYLTITGNGAFAMSETPMVPAETKPVSQESLEVQIRKTGATSFVIRNLEMKYDGTKFLPMKSINELRRAFLLECEKLLIAKTSGRVTRDYSAKKMGQPEKTMPVIQVYTNSVASAKAAHSAGAGQVVYEGFEEIYDHAIIYQLPKILHPDDFAKALAKIPASAFGVMVEGAGGAEEIKGVPKYGGIGLNIMNSRAGMVYGRSCRQICLSPELSGKQIRNLMAHLAAYEHPPKTEVLVQGSLEVMITQNCIPATALGCRSCNQSWALKDATGRVFRVRTDNSHKNRILNAAEICLIDHVDKLASAGVSVISIDARGRSPEYIRRMVAIYLRALEGEDVKLLKEEIRVMASGGITAAHYLRGVEKE